MLKLATLALALMGVAGASLADPPRVPTGRLPDTVRPTAYRLDLTVDPAAARFSGHTEIDAVLTQPTQHIFLHGAELRISRVQVLAGRVVRTARYVEVDESGVARLDLPSRLPAGKVTLRFDYTAAFRDSAEGLFHAKVGNDWYAWTQFEPIDARRVFPAFDEPGFKTPFTVTIRAPRSAKVFANAPEARTTASGSMLIHRFAPTKPLPTYLVAMGVGPFEVVDVRVAPNTIRSWPLSMRVIAAKGQRSRMGLAAAEAPKILGLLEAYLGSAYPYEKLDLMTSPLHGGAMENAGLIIFQDSFLLVDAVAPLRQLRIFAEITSHEMAHQWFGDSVTPVWWTDIWLNESFAAWMGKKIGAQWRPDLGLEASRIDEAFDAMNDDALGHGRPIHQVITENTQIVSAFDDITYKKGAQVLSMFENYLGHDRFQKGVRLHLERYRYGSATADDFFRSLGEAASDPMIVPALRTFTDQTGIPVVKVIETPDGVTLLQTRYRPLGIDSVTAQTWMIPMCLTRAGDRACTMLASAKASVPALPGDAALTPNAGGSGYYRFSLDGPGWDRLMSAAGTLPGREAMVAADSLWADFAAGRASFQSVVTGARALSANPERLAALALAYRLADLANSVLTVEQIPRYRALVRSIYEPRLSAIGLDPRVGAHAAEPMATQALRQSLVPIVALEARPPDLRARLAVAAVAYLNGDTLALDPAFRVTAFIVAVQDRGAPFMAQLKDALVASTDPLFRQDASGALGSVDTPELATAALDLAWSPGMQTPETLTIVMGPAGSVGGRATVVEFVDKNFARVVDLFPGYERQGVLAIFAGECADGDVARLDALIQPRLKMIGAGELELAQTRERIELCTALRRAKGTEIAEVLAR